ncbi:TonB-dependent receptor plug [Mucilaginibacter paludis DSM 18603]|uniref:TonB-dependent receptor plug n=1 Tax=Mucilaginibacter paludis DSM 18603 TaxID=714943 RepID=H1Y3G0_9SPHI|nr:TonB-dependent receptor plug [Mucilaginibacter paludis DSM 18603]
MYNFYPKKFVRPCIFQGSTAKILLTMRLTVILLITAILQVSASSFAQKITLNKKQALLVDVLRDIRKQSGYDFAFTNSTLDKAKPVDVNVTGVDVEEALRLVFKDQPLDYVIKDKVVVVSPKVKTPEKSLGEALKPISVDGRVIDEKGSPLQGATVVVKGTKLISITSADGKFHFLDIDDKSVLVISFIGYITVELPTKAQMGDITLELGNAKLSEVVVSTGYQKISKERFVGSFSQLDSANYARRAGMGIIDRLDGTVTGLLFNKKGGAAFPIQVRGISTLGVSQTPTSPLIVVDNFPMEDAFDINSINANDVENITVLKDAAAASIWGTRAGNGVIVITTKRGKLNQPLRVSITSNVSVDEKQKLDYFPTVSPSDFIDIEQMLFNKGYYDSNINNTDDRPVLSPVVEILAQTRNGLSLTDAAAQINALRGHDLRNDLNKYVYRNPLRQQYQTSLTGGSNNLAYQFSLGYNNTLNSTIGSKPDQQFTVNSNTTYKVSKKLELQFGINYSQGLAKSYTLQLPSTTAPYASLVDNNGGPAAIANTYRLAYIDTVGGGKLLDWHYRPLDEIRNADNTRKSYFTRFNVATSYAVTNWLKANIQYQYTVATGSSENIQSLNTYSTRNTINGFTLPNVTGIAKYQVPYGGIVDISNSENISNNVRGTLNFNKAWNGDNVITGLIGAELSNIYGLTSAQRLYGYNENTGSVTQVLNYADYYPIFYGASPGASAQISTVNLLQESLTNRIVSILGNVSYSYKDKYTLFGSARRDGANVFGVSTNNKWKPLWSVGGSWDISKEEYFKVDWVASLRLRSSFGYTGNVNNRLSGKFTFFSSSDPVILTGLDYASANQPPNPNLRWEQNATLNFGIDYQLFKGRLSGTFEVYSKKSTDVIANKYLPISSGVNFTPINAADLKGSGFDLNINSVNTIGKISWSTNIGLSYAKTIVTKIDKPTAITVRDLSGYSVNAVPGQLAYGLASYKWAGLDPVTGDPRGYYQGQISNNYNLIATDSIQNQVFHGSSIPLYSGFIRNNISYRGFTLSFNLTARFKYFFREPVMDLDYVNAVNSNFLSADYYNRWQKPGDELITNIPSMSYPASGNTSSKNSFYQLSEITVKKADNIRIQDLRLAYDFSIGNFSSKKYHLQTFLYANNLNLILWKAAKTNYDPDFVGGNGGFTAPIKTLTAGLNVNF